jgi:hypothetical protein
MYKHLVVKILFQNLGQSTMKIDVFVLNVIVTDVTETIFCKNSISKDFFFLLGSVGNFFAQGVWDHYK